MNEYGLLILGIIVVITLIFIFLRSKDFLPYFFFLRYPFIFGLILFLTPFFIPDDPNSSISNMFIQSSVGIMLTSWLALFTAWTVMYAILYLWMRIPIRTKLAFSRTENTKPEEDRRNYLFPPLRWPGMRLLVSSFLAFPLIGVCINRSLNENPEVGGYGWAILGALCAIGSFVVFSGIRWIVLQLSPPLLRSGLKYLAQCPILIDFFLLGIKETNRVRTGFEVSIPGESTSRFHATNAIVFGIGILGVYAAGYKWLHPMTGELILRENIPALAYVLILFMLLITLLTWSSFQFDRYRTPPELVILLFAAIFWWWSKADHFYGIQKLQCPPPEYKREWGPAESISSWKPQNSPPPPLIIVAVSGGGIKAASWTATVLTRLSAQVPKFSESVRLVSSVSGGSVGAMYFVNGYTQKGPPTDLESIRAAAARPSLPAMAWGVAYPDFWRFFLPFIPGSEEDRGWALEDKWSSEFGKDDPNYSTPTLGSWYGGVKRGWRPAVVFNATIVETGQQFVISNLDFKFPEESDLMKEIGNTSVPVRRVQSFRRLYPGADMRVTTASRLSATFPWVTPVARPLTNCTEVEPYHIADGGYYDNFGMVSIIQYLREALPTYKARGGKEVLIVQIRASDTTQVEPADPHSGFLFETIGPATTMLAVRSASQIARNDLDFRLIRDQWGSKGVSIKDVIFELRTPAPLSWQLADSERKNIEGYFQCPDVQGKVAEVASIFGDSPLAKDKDAFNVLCPMT